MVWATNYSAVVCLGTDNGEQGALCQSVISAIQGYLPYDLHRASLFSDPSAPQPLNFIKKNAVTMDVGIQTDRIMVGINGQKTMHEDTGADITEEEAVTCLPASALASVLKWSKDIATDIHLYSGKHSLAQLIITDLAD